MNLMFSLLHECVIYVIMIMMIIIMIINIIYLTCSWAICWPVSVSHIQKSLQWSPLTPFAFWSAVFIIHGNLLRGSLFTCCIQVLRGPTLKI